MNDRLSPKNQMTGSISKRINHSFTTVVVSTALWQWIVDNDAMDMGSFPISPLRDRSSTVHGHLLGIKKQTSLIVQWCH